MPASRSIPAAALLLLAASVPLAGCGSGPDDREPAPAGDLTSGKAPGEGTAQPVAIDSSRLIGPDGIGQARAGMTIGELRAALPPGTVLGAAEPFMVDVAGLPVVRGADTLYHVLVVSGEPSGDDAPITHVATLNETFRTAEGVGPGTTLADAAATYGAPTLSYSFDDESREYAAFADYPHADVRFRVNAGADGSRMAGAYTSEGEYNETREYDRSARIWMVMVDLRREPRE